MTAPTSDPGTGHATSLRSVWPAILGLSIVFLTEMLDNSVLNVALPTITRELGATAAELQWITTAYSLLFGGLMLVFGMISDRFGRRRVMLIGLSLFAVASLAVVLVRTPGELIAVRGVIGVAAAMTAPGSMALSFRLFDDETLRVRATALISTVGLTGLAIGPTFGGLILALWPWQALLIINVPVAALAACCIRFGIRADQASELHLAPLDITGALLGTATITLALWAATLAVEDGWNTLSPWSAGIGALICGAGFVIRERRAKNPMLDFDLLRRPLVTAGLTYQAALGLGLAVIGYSVTLQLQLAWGWPPALAALGNLPQVITMIAAGPLVEKVVKKVGMQKAGPLGAGIAIAGLVTYAIGGRYHYAWIAVTLILTAAGMRLVMITAAVNVMHGLPADRTSIGAAMNDTGQEVASSIGLAITGTIIAAFLTGSLARIGRDATETTEFNNAVTTATLVLAAACALLVIWAANLARRGTAPPSTQSDE